jgi:hypothetical protein
MARLNSQSVSNIIPKFDRFPMVEGMVPDNKEKSALRISSKECLDLDSYFVSIFHYPDTYLPKEV